MKPTSKDFSMRVYHKGCASLHCRAVPRESSLGTCFSTILKIDDANIYWWASSLFRYGHPDPLAFLLEALPKKWRKIIKAKCAKYLLRIVEGGCP